MGNIRIVLVLLLCLILSACLDNPEQKAKKYVVSGDTFYSQGKFKEAAIEYKNAVDIYPKNADIRWKLAKSALEGKDFKTAFNELQKIVRLDPENYEAKGKLGELYVASGKIDAAKNIVEDFLKNRPEDPKGYILQSGIDARQGKLLKAIAHMKKALGLDPGNSWIMLSLGKLYQLKPDRKRALRWYDKALEKNPDSVDGHLARGTFLFSSGKDEEGEKEYRKAIELSADKEKIRLTLASFYFSRGRVTEAESELQKAIDESGSQNARKVLAEIKIEDGRLEEAERIVGEILKENSEDIYGKYLQGRIDLANNRLNEAKSLFDEVIRSDRDINLAYVFKGMIEVKQGNMEAGKNDLKEALKLNPGNIKAHLILGDLYIKSNNPEGAEEEALEVLKRNPSNLNAFIIYGDSFLIRKKLAKAEQVYTAMIRQGPNRPEGYFKMGILKKLQGKHNSAANYFEKAVVRGNNDIKIVNEYLLALVNAKKRKKATEKMAGYLKKDPSNPLLWELNGRLSLALKNPGKAEKAFLKSIELFPGFAPPYYELGVLYTSQKRLLEAREKFEKVLDREPNNPGAHTMLGIVLQTLGELDKANKYFRRALEIEPSNPIAANNLASNLSNHGGNIDEALKFARMARKSSPDDPRVADTLGWIYYKKDLIDLAFPLLQSAWEKLGTIPVVNYHYGMALIKKGRVNEGKAKLESALKLDPDFPGSLDAKRTLHSFP